MIVEVGPAGVLLALKLAKEHINVTVLEAASTLDIQPRAIHYGPPGVAELRRAGILEEVRRLGFVPKGIMWRRIDGIPITGVDVEIGNKQKTRMEADYVVGCDGVNSQVRKSLFGSAMGVESAHACGLI